MQKNSAHKAVMQTELNLDSTMGELGCIWIKGVNASDFQEALQPLLEIAEQLGQLRVDNLVAFASSQLASYLGPSFLRVLRCIRNNFINCSRFPYHEHTTNEWFYLPDEDSQRKESVKAINIVKEEGAIAKYSAILNDYQKNLKSISEDGFEILFHGTSHKYAQDIIEGGINVKRGQKGKDFSNGDGFYLGNRFDAAKEWPKLRRLTNSAVLVFRVEKTELRGDGNTKGLDLCGYEKKEKWQEVVSQYRSGQPDTEFIEEMKKYEFIEGPMASLPRNNRNLNCLPPKFGTYQLCVRTDECAELFDRSLHSVLFFS